MVSCFVINEDMRVSDSMFNKQTELVFVPTIDKLIII